MRKNNKKIIQLILPIFKLFSSSLSFIFQIFKLIIERRILLMITIVLDLSIIISHKNDTYNLNKKHSNLFLSPLINYFHLSYQFRS